MQTAIVRRLLWLDSPLEILSAHQLAELVRIKTFICEAKACGFPNWEAALRAHYDRRLHAMGATPRLDPSRN